MIWKEDLKKVIAVALALVLFLNVFQGNFWNAEAAREGDLTTVSGNETRDLGSDTGTVVESIAEQALAQELESKSEPALETEIDQFHAAEGDDGETVTQMSYIGENQTWDMAAPEAEAVEAAGNAEEILTDEDFEIAAEQAEGEYLDLAECITAITTDAGNNPIGFSYNSGDKLRVTLDFRLPVEEERPIGKNYLYKLDLTQVFAKQKGSEAYNLIPALKDLNQAGTSEKVQLAGEQDGGYFFIQDGVIYFNFEESVDRLQNSDIARDGWFVFECRLNEKAYQNAESEYELVFSHKADVPKPTITVAEKDPYDMGLVVNKTAGAIQPDQTVQYTITVQNTEDSSVSGITLQDELWKYLSLKPESVQPAGVTAAQDQADENKITFTLPEIKGKETLTITYTCDIANGAYITQNNTSGGTNGLGNKISATYTDDKNKKHPVDLGDGSKEKTCWDVKISKDMVFKSNVNVASSDEDGSTTVQWTITVNAGKDAFNLDGLQFTDGFQGSSNEGEIVFLEDSFVFRGVNGQAVPSNVQSGIKNAIMNKEDYKFPDATGNLSFTVTYQTKLTPPAGSGTKTYANLVTVAKDTDKDEAWSTTGEIGQSLFEKTAVDFDKDDLHLTKSGDLILHWQTTIHVPSDLKSGDTLKGTDRIYLNGDNELYFSDDTGERLDESTPSSSIVVQLNGSLLDADAYTLTLNNPDPAVGQQERSFTIEFVTGKLAEKGAAGKDITIDYYTVGAYADKVVNPYYKLPYRNYFDLVYNNYNGTKNKVVELAKSQETKPGDFLSKSVESVDNKNHTITWKVTIDPAGGELNDIVLEDTFESKQMQFYGIERDGFRNLFKETGAYYAYVEEEEAPWGKYEFKLEPDGEGKLLLKFDAGYLKKRWNFTGQDFPKITRKMSVYYTTQLKDSELQQGGNITKKYSNTVTYTDNTDSAKTLKKTAETDVDIKILEKEGESAGNKGIKYTLTVNPQGMNLSGLDYLHVNDELPNNQILQINTVTVTDNSGTALKSTTDEKQVAPGQGLYKLSYVGDIWQFVVPDETPLTITFYVKPLAASEEGSISYSNTVTIPEPYVEKAISDSKHVNHQVASSAAGLAGQKFALEKMDAADVTKKLAGAEFTATEWVYNTETEKWDSTTTTFVGKTDATGKMTSSDFKASDGTSQQMQYGRIYEIRETKAPAGYELTGTTYKFIILNPADADAKREKLLKNLPDGTVPINTGFIFYFYDDKKEVERNELTITKRYVAADGKALPAADMPQADDKKAEFALYKGNYTWAACENGSVPEANLCQEGSTDYFFYEYDKKADTITLQNIPGGTYTLYEKTAPEGFQRWTDVYQFTVDGETKKITWDGNTAGSDKVQAVTLENRKAIANRFEIQKTYLAPDGTALTGAKIPQAAVFYYRQTHTYNEAGKTYVAVQNAQRKEIPTTTDSISYVLKNLEPGIYEITEETFDMYKPNGQLPYRLEVSSTGKITVYKGTTVVTGNVIADNTTDDVTVQVTNQVRENEIKVIKEYYGAGGQRLTAETERNAVGTKFTLQKYINSEWKDVDAKQPSLNDDNIDTLQDQYSLKNLEPGDYRIRESMNGSDEAKWYAPQPPIYFSVINDWSILMRDETAGRYLQEIVVKNTQFESEPARFYFTKEYVDHTGRVIDNFISDADNQSIFVYYKAEDVDEITGVATGEGNSIPYKNETGRYEIEGLGAPDGIEQKYIIRETKCPPTHELIGDIYLTVKIETVDGKPVAHITDVEYDDQYKKDITTSVTKEDGEETVTARLVNRPKENSITVTKTYLLADGATEDTNVSDSEKARFTLQKKQANGYTAVGDAKTASDDNKYEFKNLDPGEYRLVETRRPNGFTGCEPLAFEVNQDYEIKVDTPLAEGWQTPVTSDDYNVNVTAKNTRRTNKFILEKYYILAVNNEVRWDDARYADLKNKTTFVLKDESGADISTAAGFAYNETDHVWKVENLTEGTYTIEETAPAGYQQAGSIRLVVKDGNITATYQGTDRENFTTTSKADPAYRNGTSQVKAELGNAKVQNKLTVTKIYLEANGDRIPYNTVLNYARFTLQKKEAGGSFTYVNGKISNSNMHQGRYEIKGLEQGDYVLKEQALAGFPSVEQTFEFSVNPDGKISCLTDLGEENPWSIEADDENKLDVQISIVNRKASNEFKLMKAFYDVNGNRIPDTAEAIKDLRKDTDFEIKGINGTKDPAAGSYGWNQDEDGTFTVTNLRRGTYEIKETVPPGYDEAVGTVQLEVDNTGNITARYIPHQGGAETDFSLNRGSKNGALTVQATLINHQLTNALQINKQYVSAEGTPIDVSQCKPADLAKFELQEKNGNSYTTVTSASSGYVARSAEGLYQFKNIPAGDYRIVEIPPDKYADYTEDTDKKYIEFTVANDSQILITEPEATPAAVGDTETSKTVRLTNRRELIGLELEKKFYAGDEEVSEEEAKKAFAEVIFELHDAQGNPVGKVIKDPDERMVYFTEISEDGEYTILETKTGEDYQLAKEIRLTVAGTGVTAEYMGDSADFTFVRSEDNFSPQMTLINREKESELIITKTIKGDVTKEEAEGALVFTVTDTATGEETTYRLSEFTYDEQTKQYRLELSVPAGVYEVKETVTDINGYTLASVTNTVNSVKSDGDGKLASVTIAKHDTVTVAYEDVYTTDIGTLRITKTIKGDVTREEAEGALQFKVTENKSGEAKVYTLKDFTYDEASKVYTLELKQKAGGYTVEETVYNIAGYAVESVKYSVDGAAQQTGSKAEVTIKKDAVTSVAFEDNYTDQPGELIITKTIKGDVTREEAEGALRFKVTNNDTGFVQEFTLKDFKYNKKTGVWTLKLPAAAGGYTVEETVSDVDGFDTASVKYTVGDGNKKKGSSAQAQVESGQKTTVAFEDTYNKKKGRLRITKSVWGDVSREEAEESLVFTVTDHKTGKKTDYKLKDFKYDANRNQYYLELDLPNGSYTVEETNYTIPDHYLETNTVSVDGEKPWGSFITDAQVKVNKTTKVAFEDRYTSKLTSTALITKLTTTLTKSNLVKTGDEAPLGLWLLMLILSAGGFIAGVVLLRKKSGEDAA